MRRKINAIARQARIGAYGSSLRQKLKDKIIDTSKPAFADLVSNRGKPMESLNGEIILDRELAENGTLMGVHSVSLDSLAVLLPELKQDAEDKAGWKKWLDQWKAEGLNDILVGVADPNPDEYELSAVEELATLDIGSMSDFEAKQKLIALQIELAQEGI